MLLLFVSHCRQLEVDSRPEAFTEVEKVVPKLMTAIDDAHFKVRLGARRVVHAVTRGVWGVVGVRCCITDCLPDGL